MIHIHKWGKWSEPYETQYALYRNGCEIAGAVRVKSLQIRSCSKCNRVQERQI